MIGLGQAHRTHVSSQRDWRLQLQQGHIVDNAIGIVVGMDNGLDHLPDNARIPGGSVDLQQANGDLIPIAVDTMSCGQHITIIDQGATAEEPGIVATLDQLGGPRVLVGAHLLAAHNTVDIRGATDCEKIKIYYLKFLKEILKNQLSSS